MFHTIDQTQRYHVGFQTPTAASIRPAWPVALTIILLAQSAGPARSAEIADRPSADPLIGQPVPTGKKITPTAAKGAIFRQLNPNNPAVPDQVDGGASAIVASPDGKTLAILTSGFNMYNGAIGKSGAKLWPEHVFLFDISGPQPKQIQVLSLPNSFQGLAWAPKSDRFFASGGDDDTVVEFHREGSSFDAGQAIHLSHKAGLGIQTDPMVAGLAVSPDGSKLLAANLQNDSVSLVDLNSAQIVAEQDLRPGIVDPRRHGQLGGTYPRSVVWSSPGHAYVASERDREIISLAVSSQGRLHVIRRIPVSGQPVALITNRSGSRLYAALDTTNRVAVFDTTGDQLIEAIDVTAPPNMYANAQMLGGADTNALALTPDERTLLVSNGGENAVAVVRLGNHARGAAVDSRAEPSDKDEGSALDHSEVVGLVPTGWYPDGVAMSKDGTVWYVVNAKSPAGPNARWCREADPVSKLCVPKSTGPDQPVTAANGSSVSLRENLFPGQLVKAGFLTFPAPMPLELARLTKQVARNDYFDHPDKTAGDERLFSFLREHIKHVVYIIKENRTYDQVLGDVGNGDPRLTLFPEKKTPNHHAVVRDFVTLDNFLVSGNGSADGWWWSVAAQTNDFMEQSRFTRPRGAALGDFWGANRNLNMGYATSQERRAESAISPADPDILPGARDVEAPDGPGGKEGKGNIWDAVLRRGLTVRNYGCFGLVDWLEPLDRHTPLTRDPFAQKVKMFFPTARTLIPLTDAYYRGWDPAYPDYWRFQEWKREFDAFSKSGTLPNLMLVELGNDHFGSYERAIDGVNTPDTQMADNDYALGLMIETIANSSFAKDTLIVALEDDPSDGPDHVDAFRSVALIAGPYVRQHAIVSTRYTTVSVIKTIEEIMGIGPIGLNDALAAPMSDIFDPNQATWSYKAIVPDVLRSTQLPLPPADHASIEYPRHTAAYWARAMAGQDFSGPDRIEPVSFNQALWRGLEGDTPMP